MKRLGLSALVVWALVSVLSAQAGRRAPARSAETVAPAKLAVSHPRPATSRPAAHGPAAAAAHATFEKYCTECHSGARPKANLSIDKLTERMSSTAVGEQADTWEEIASMLETRDMPPPDDAEAFPTDKERAAAIAWVKASLGQYETEHGGDPGRVTVRRLTSAEYGYAIRDLTGVDIKVGIDASSDSVGGEGFANFGDVQFVQDATVERYLEAAKQVADHAVIGAGPLAFYSDPGKTGLELSALNRINELYTSRGFRAVSGEGGRPFGFDRYAKALYVAWHFKHRAALGDASATLRGLAAKEGITGRFADHIWEVVNRPAPGYPTSDTVERWRAFPAPTADVKASIAKARTEADAVTKALVSWPSWLFARGDLAAGGAGDESPLVFDDTTLGVEPSHSYVYALNRRFGPRAPTPPSGPWTVHLAIDALNRAASEKPAVIWRNARVVLREPPAPPKPDEPVAVVRLRMPGPIQKTFPLREVLKPADAAKLALGRGPEGVTMGPNDFATSEATSFLVDVPAGSLLAELHVDVEVGPDRDAVVRVMVANRADATSRIPGQRIFVGDPASAGYKAFRAAMAEYVASLPPNSHGEANPADKDPVPPPFDNTYNSPEHDAFVLKVKYQRTDDFFTRNMVDGKDRAALENAWADLFGSWPYHDAYLGMLLDHYSVTTGPRKIDAMTPAAIAALPAAVRPMVRAVRTHFDTTMAAMKTSAPGQVTDAVAFASKAWRRPLTSAERVELRAFYRMQRSVARLDHEAALRALIARVLMSPAFLYRVEAAPRGTEITLNDWELASRMSFFLWSSIPDDELRRAAGAGELSQPARLAAQVRRMTADPKARRLATEFFGQWLGFYHFDQYRGVDTGRFPEFTDDVRSSMYDEAISTFEYLVRQDRPVREILHADYAFLNPALAKFYGVEATLAGKDGRVERVDGTAKFNRGGALRLGSVLTTTSAPLRTSPVKRGDWILRRILSTPTPPPPADAGTLPADDKSFDGQTLRERLTAHKRDAKCASCHLRIDPLGFPLEGFDAVGRTRQTYNDGKPVDTTGEFRDKSTIVGSDGLLKYLLTQDAKVMTTLSRKMIGYALGRNPQPSDRRLIGEMRKAGGTATFADLATRVVTSRQFRNRVRGADPVPVPAPAAGADGQSSGAENNP